MIRANGEYFDLYPDDRPSIEKSIKLFEEIGDIRGDYAYQFMLPSTARNLEIIGYPFPDIADKAIYRNIPCDILNSSGEVIHSGILKVETVNGEGINCSFLSGNFNWFRLIPGALYDPNDLVNSLDFSEYDTELTDGDIINSMVNTDGINFPLIDTGGLITRGYKNLRVEDFNGCLYVKTIFRKIFNKAGIKLQGDLLNDRLFNTAMIFNSNKDKEELEASSCHVQKSSTTNRPGENVDYKMTFQNDSTFPYFDGSNDAFDLANSRYVAPYPMTVVVECTLTPSVVDSSYNNRIRLYINGAYTFVDIGLDAGAGGLYNSATPGDRATFTIKRNIFLETGDILEVYSNWQQSTGSTANNVTSGTLRITPVFIYKAFGNSMLPKWTKLQFVSNVLNLFNVITDFDPHSKTLTLDLFEKITTKTPIDLSEHVTIDEVDFVQAVQSYGKNNTFSYKESSEEDLKDYNITHFVKYGQGVINIDNDFLSESEEIISSDFSTPVSYINNVFNASLERIKIFDYEEAETVDFTAVTDSSGNARFAIPRNPFQRLDLIRISNSTNPEYNGDWVINANSTTFLQVQGLEFKSDATGTLTKINHTYANNDNVYIIINVPFYSVSDFSSESSFYFIEDVRSSLSYGFFNILNTGRNVNTAFNQSLSFGSISSSLAYQRSLLDTYWRKVSSVLNDPVTLKCSAKLPATVFKRLTPLKPVHIKTLKTSNLYYINRISNYVESYIPCLIELIKIL